MSTTTTSSAKEKKKKEQKKGSSVGYIVAGVATAAVVGAGIYFLSGTASAKGKKGAGAKSKAKAQGAGAVSPTPRAKDGTNPGGGATPRGDAKGGGTGGGTGPGGSAGPGGTLPAGGGTNGGSSSGSGRPSGDSTPPEPTPPETNEGEENEGVPMGFFWGDKSKIPASFDYQSNQIWIAPDRTAAAAGFYFFMDGLDANGNRVTWDEDGLSFLISDGSVLRPTKDRDHREDPVPSLRKILRNKDPDTGALRLDSVFSWLAAYYGTGLSPMEAATSRGVDLLQDMVDEASVLSGGRKRPMNLNGPLRSFYGYALGRLEMGRRALYGDGFAWGQGEDAIG